MNLHLILELELRKMLKYLRDPILRQYTDLAKFLQLPILFANTEWLQAPSVEGQYRTRHVRVFSFYVSKLVGSREHRRMKTYAYTSVFVQFDNFYKYQLSVAPGKPGHKIFRKLKNLFFEDDTDAGERLLFDNYTLATNDNYFADSILENGFQDLLLTHIKSLRGMLRIENNIIVYTERAMIDRDDTRERFEEMTDLAVELAEIIEGFAERYRAS